MATYYWVGGTGTWDTTTTTNWSATSGGAGGAGVPGLADIARIDASSGTGTITCTAGRCNTLTVTATQAITLGATSSTLTVTSDLTFPTGGSFAVAAGLTLTLGGQTVGSGLTGARTFVTGGKTLGILVIDGFSSQSWTLTGALTCTNSITLNSGTFNTAGFAVSCSSFVIPTSSISRTLTLGASTITCSSTWTVNSTAWLTFNANTSTISLSNAVNFQFTGGGLAYNDVTFTSTAANTITIAGSNSFNNLTFASPSSNIKAASFSADQVIGGTLTCNGATIIRRILLRSDTMGTTRTLYVAAESLSNCDFRDIAGAGAAAPFTGSNFGNCGGNSGITFPAAKTVYWNLGGTTTNWSATAWATSSGGTPALANFPLAQDTAVIDNTGTVPSTAIQIETNWNIGTLNMSNRTSAVTITHPGLPTIYGDFTVGTGVSLTSAATLTFSGRTTQTITTAGKTFVFPVIIDSPGGTVQLNGNFTSSVAAASVALTLTRGTFDAVTYDLSLSQFSSSNSNARTINMGSGTWTLTGTALVWTTNTLTNLTLNKQTSNIVISNTSTTSRSFASGGNSLSFPKISFYLAGYTLTFTNAISMDELASIPFSTANTITFSTNAASTVGTWSVKGVSGTVPNITSATSGTTAIVNVTNKTTSDIDYLSFRDITCNTLDPVTFFVGSNSTNVSNNNGVAFTTTNYNIHVLTSGASWSVPSDFNPSGNTIHLFGGGGGGANGYTTVGKIGGGGGGGGGYTKAINVPLTPSSSVAITVGGGGASGTTGGTGGSTSISGYTANGGTGGTATTGNSTGGTGGTGSTYNGGNGGAGATSGTYTGGGGGGGAGGPNGQGGRGGTGFGSSTAPAGGGGGGNGGGTNGGNGSSTQGGDGGDSIVSSTTGGAGTTGVGNSGTFGGGGAGSRGTSAIASGNGGSGIDILNSFGGAGGKGGQSSSTVVGANTGLYGGGGGGGAATTGAYSGGAGSQGAIIIVYTAGGPVAQNSNFFLLFG